MNNRRVAEIFDTMADMLDIKGAGYHRVRAYRRAAENLAALGEPLEEIWRRGELETIPGIGKTLAEKIDELVRTGDLGAYRQLRSEIPEGVVDMLEIGGIGPKTAARFWKELGIETIEALERAGQAGRLRTLSGMGAKREENVLAGIRAVKRRTGRMGLDEAWFLAKEILSTVRDAPDVLQSAPAGSLRRRQETVGDLDLLVAATDPNPVMERFLRLSHVDQVLLSGPTKTSIRTHQGVQVDLRVVEPARWGTALQYFTGSQAHNIRVRGLALERGLSLSEYALKREDGREILCATEEEVYRALGLPLIPPELREDRGEVEAALDGALPELVELGDLRGDLQFHTTWSDGHYSLLEMAESARAQGLDYALVTDHTFSLGVTRGLDLDRLRAQQAEIAAVNDRLGGTFRVLAGAEVEIRADGSLDFPDDVLAELDLVVGAVHTGLRQGRDRVTSRLLTAIHNPHVDIIAHPTGRLIREREGADVDMEAVLRAAAATRTALEINAFPARLDLNDVHTRRAVELGVPLAINSDAHVVEGFDQLRFGVATARRGWASRADIINARPLESLLDWAMRNHD